MYHIPVQPKYAATYMAGSTMIAKSKIVQKYSMEYRVLISQYPPQLLFRKQESSTSNGISATSTNHKPFLQTAAQIMNQRQQHTVCSSHAAVQMLMVPGTV